MLFNGFNLFYSFQISDDPAVKTGIMGLSIDEGFVILIARVVLTWETDGHLDDSYNALQWLHSLQSSRAIKIE